MSPRPSAPRLEWVDAARGYSVVAVVLFHVVLWQYAAIDGLDPRADAVWGKVNSLLGAVRMPLLLAVSGLVLSRQVREGLRRSTTGFRSANNYYLYVVWLLVYAAFYAVVQQPYLAHRVDGLDVLTQLVVPGTTLWYLLALAVYVPALALLRRVPPWMVLVGAVVISSIAHTALYPGSLWLKVPELLVFFVVGVYGAGAIRRLAGRAGWLTLVLTATVAVGVVAAGRFAGSPVVDGVYFVVRGLAFLVLAVTVVVIAARWRPFSAFGGGLGRRTLAIYVLHPLLIALLTILGREVAPRQVEAAASSTPVAMLAPLAITAVVVATAVAVQVLAERTHLSVLFEMPRQWQARLGRGPSARTAAPVEDPELTKPSQT